MRRHTGPRSSKPTRSPGRDLHRAHEYVRERGVPRGGPALGESAHHAEDPITDLKYKDINRINVDDFERREHEYIRALRKEIDGFIREALRASEVKIDYRADRIPGREIDERILDSRIFGKRALEYEKLQNLSGFQEYLVAKVYGPEETVKAGRLSDPLEKELLELKIQNFIENIRTLPAVNPDIYYKMKMKLDVMPLFRQRDLTHICLTFMFHQ